MHPRVYVLALPHYLDTRTGGILLEKVYLHTKSELFRSKISKVIVLLASPALGHWGMCPSSNLFFSALVHAYNS